MYRSGLYVSNARWVSRRWYPTVMPKAVGRYSATRMARSRALTPSFQNRAMAPITQRNGTTTAAMFT